MAEIRIERKRRGLGLLWLFLALVLAAVLAWYFLYPGDTTPPAPAPPTTGRIESGSTHGLAMAGRGSQETRGTFPKASARPAVRDAKSRNLRPADT